MARTIDCGAGAPILMVPGVQGHWQWMRQAVDALAVRYRVLTFSLDDDGAGLDTSGFDHYLLQIDDVLDRAQVRNAVILGVSLGGIIAARYAARRPDRTSKLALVVTPGPHWTLSDHQRTYVAHPWRSLPIFAVRATRHLIPEVFAAIPRWPARLAFLARYGWVCTRFGASPPRMAERVRRSQAIDLAADCRTISAPTLVLTGEPALDHVVSVAGSLQYLDLIPSARHVTLARTGHLGLVSRPDEFATIVGRFVDGTMPTYDR